MAHLVRRGAVYHWRRRFGGPALGCPAGIVTLSLFTKEKAVARRRGAELTLMSETLSEAIRLRRLTPEEAKSVLVAVACRHMAKLDLHAAFDRQRSRPEPMSGERADRVVGAAYRLLAERGRAAGLGDNDGAFLTACGLDPSETLQINTLLSVWREQGLVPPGPGKMRSLLTEHAPAAEPTATTLAEAETLFYRGMAAACLRTGARWGATLEADLALLDASMLYEPTRIDAPPPPGPTTDPEIAPVPLPTKAPAPAAAASRSEGPEPDLAAISIVGMAESLIALKLKKKEWTDKTGSQMRQTASLLVKITGRQAITQLRQADLARFADTLLLEFPKAYGRSSRDAKKAVGQLLAEAAELSPEKRGLEGATVNRHLTHLGNLIEFADGRGIRPAETLKLATLRSRKKGRDRDARPPFTRDQLVTFFASPIWRGCDSERKRLVPGGIVIHDALYWATPIAAYSLMRREEICGLMVTDVVFDAPIPYFDLKPNVYRRLKNDQSKRRIPIHPELLRLGLISYIEAVSTLGYDLLFPELLPASGTALLGEQLYDDWLPALRSAVLGASKAGVVFHSIRHYGNDRLVDAKVMLEWRQDILGHAGASEAEERYRDDTDLKRKLGALKKLPLVTGDLLVVPTRLRALVEAKGKRRARTISLRP